MFKTQCFLQGDVEGYPLGMCKEIWFLAEKALELGAERYRSALCELLYVSARCRKFLAKLQGRAASRNLLIPNCCKLFSPPYENEKKVVAAKVFWSQNCGEKTLLQCESSWVRNCCKSWWILQIKLQSLVYMSMCACSWATWGSRSLFPEIIMWDCG